MQAKTGSRQAALSGLRSPGELPVRARCATAPRSAPRAPRAIQRPDAPARDSVSGAPDGGRDADASSSSTGASSSGCPVLASLRTPPQVAVPWWQRLKQFKDPLMWQGTLLRDHDIVFTPSQLGLPAQVLPGTLEMAKAVLAREGDLTLAAPFFSTSELLQDGNIGWMPEPQHREFRSMLQPAFTHDTINGPFLPEIVSIIDAALARWADARAPVGAYSQFKRMTFEIIMTVMMGKSYTAQEVDRLHHMFNTFTNGLFGWPQLNLPWTPYGKALAARRELLQLFARDVAAARAADAAGEEVAGQLGVMVRARDAEGNSLPDELIRENLLGLLFAGHDTTSSSLVQLLAVLQDHPAVVARLRAEQAALVARHGVGVSAALLKDMVYADAVIKESMRFNILATELTRVAARDFEMGGCRVEKGTAIAVPLGHIGAADPRWAGAEGDMAPGVFNPDRMLTPEGAKPGSLMPFGHASRFCLGYHLAIAEMKVTLALLMQRYEFSADSGGKWEYTFGKLPANGLPTLVTRLAPGAAPA